MSVRLDKWLQVARVFKTRTQATRACSLSRVRVNGTIAKAHRSLAIDDQIEVQKGDWQRVLVVKELKDKPLPKAEAPRLYEDHSPPPPPRDSLERLLRSSPVRRERGSGRPTKRDRRDIEKLRR
ncbi:MAG: RNA-binding S4 domain-containing protein [Deltaproteobacteria bacterium]|nr:RNA-binding S4 domain-containing protein [Deltaproteobacteria bacterium]